MPRGHSARLNSKATRSNLNTARPLLLSRRQPGQPFVSQAAATTTTAITVAASKPHAIHEVKSLAEMSAFYLGLPVPSLIVFDLDNNLMEPQQLAGSDQWFEKHLEHHTKKFAGNTKQAYAVTLPLYNYVQSHTAVRAVEPNTVKFIQDLAKKHHLLALTNRGKVIADATLQQLDSLGLEFGPRTRRDHEILLDRLMPDSPESYAKNGVIFAGGRHKGECLKIYLQHMGVVTANVPHLVFMDDKRHNVERVIGIAKELEIPSTGFRYGHLDHKIANVHLPTAEVQIAIHKHSGKFIPDSVARDISLKLMQHGIFDDHQNDTHTFQDTVTSSTTSDDIENKPSAKRVRLN